MQSVAALFNYQEGNIDLCLFQQTQVQSKEKAAFLGGAEARAALWVTEPSSSTLHNSGAGHNLIWALTVTQSDNPTSACL